MRVLDGGNRFNAYTVARAGRRPARSPGAHHGLARLHLLPGALAAGKHPRQPGPFIVLDLLNTFYDESVQAGERKRLLRAASPTCDRLEADAAGWSACTRRPSPARPPRTARVAAGLPRRILFLGSRRPGSRAAPVVLQQVPGASGI